MALPHLSLRTLLHRPPLVRVGVFVFCRPTVRLTRLCRPAAVHIMSTTVGCLFWLIDGVVS